MHAKWGYHLFVEGMVDFNLISYLLPLRYDTEMRPNINVVSDKCLVHPKRWNFHIINYPQQQSNHNDGPRETSCQHTDTWGNTRYALEYGRIYHIDCDETQSSVST
jgi:hypothetical protein